MIFVHSTWQKMSAYHATHQLARSACLKCQPNGCHICCEGMITQYISPPVAFTFSCYRKGDFYSVLFAMGKGCAVQPDSLTAFPMTVVPAVNLTSHSHSIVAYLTTSETIQLVMSATFNHHCLGLLTHHFILCWIAIVLGIKLIYLIDLEMCHYWILEAKF